MKSTIKFSVVLCFIFFTQLFFGQTASSEKNKYDIVVDANGTGNFTTVQEAIYSVVVIKTEQVIIFIKNGTYKEKLEIPENKNNITLIGESKDKVILTYDDFASKKNDEGKDIGTSGSASFIITGNNFKAQNITFENSSGPVGQAVAVRIDGDKVIFDNCKFLGFQDTLYPRSGTSRQYYKNCYIEGTVDFIFGASTAVFDQCEIFSKKEGGYITAASSLENNAYGFVFLNCKLTTNSEKNSFYLGRPWRNYAKTVFIKCEMAGHIKPEGWHNWSKPEAETTTFYGEYLSKGVGGNTISRVQWSHLLTKEQVTADYTVAKILNGWIPFLD
ncbi:pectinesterase family protein [Flavobacterium cellulosilyticum]|uniref:Pectinesterase n=1 Tax=Flavobacterium cellulosilyticum TaxID=2541731 RepID=A0A4R5CGA9_9FLAO|nr:pectinesterase family protein [Flavobacterium cellulosilyticum]TDD98705.1 pectin esterase [Flavobacterium cellulosilyticum]